MRGRSTDTPIRIRRKAACPSHRWKWLGASAMATMAAVPAALAGAAPPSIGPRVIVQGPEPGMIFSSPRAIALNPRHDEVLIANTGMHRIEVFDFDGTPLGRFVHRVIGPEGAMVDGMPHGLAVDSLGHTLVVDFMATYVDVVNVRGRSIARLELPAAGGGSARGGFDNAPGSVAVAPDGSILVGTRGDRGRIYRFSRDYQLVGSWGRPGGGPGELRSITGLAVAPEGNVVVACAQTELAVQIFDPDGGFVTGFGRHEIGDENFSFPSGVTVTADGRIWVADELRHVIKVFDSTGGLLGMVGSGGKAPGEFLYPCAVASDGRTQLAVAERVGNRFQLLSIR